MASYKSAKTSPRAARGYGGGPQLPNRERLKIPRLALSFRPSFFEPSLGGLCGLGVKVVLFLACLADFALRLFCSFAASRFRVESFLFLIAPALQLPPLALGGPAFPLAPHARMSAPVGDLRDAPRAARLVLFV